jgi:hypothetical protein
MGFVIQVVAGKAEEVPVASTGADDNAASGRLGANTAT